MPDPDLAASVTVTRPDGLVTQTPPPPLPDPVETAKSAGLLTPDDAAYIDRRMAEFGVTAQDIARNPKGILKDMSVLENQQKWRDISNQMPDFGGWLSNLHRASIVQQDLERLMVVNDAINSAKLPDPAGMFQEAGSTLKSSLVAFGTGLAAIPAALTLLPEAGINALGGDENPWSDTWISKLGSVGLENMERRQEEAADIQYRTMATGGNRVQLLIGSIIGQAPEMLATGFGGATIAKTVIGSQVAKAATRAVVGESLLAASARAAVAGRGAALSAGEIKAALTGASFIQSANEGGRSLVSRMKGNFDDGRTELITARDIGVATMTAAVVFATELLGGVTGEMRMLADGGLMAKTSFKDAIKESLIQIGQESVQEGLPQALEDLIDGNAINLSEVGWATLGGAIGGGLFGAPAFLAAIKTQLSASSAPKVDAAAKAINTLASAKGVIANAEMLSTATKPLEQTKSITLQTRSDAAGMFKAMGASGEQFIAKADIDAYAAKSNRTADEVISELGGRMEGGMAVVDTAQLMVELSARPENKADLLDIVRHKPDAPSLKDLHDKITESVAQVEEVGKQALGLMPDGVTVDDSHEVAVQFEKDLIAAGRPAQNAKMEALLVAEQVRTDADKWNMHASETGGKTLTPKQLFEKVKPAVEAGAETSRGDYNTGSRILKIGPKSDASTVVHELMHHWLNVHIQWSGLKDAPPIYRQDLNSLGAYIRVNAKSVAKKYEGATADGVVDVARNMANLDLDSPNGRAVHEFIASSFEEYMSEGKPPSKELEGVFSRMKSWILKVYRGLLRLDKTASIISGNPDERLLSDDARAVFGRMLAARDRVAPARAREIKAGDFNISPEGWELVQRARERELAEATSKLEKQAKADLAKLERKNLAARRAELEKEVRDQLSILPAYIAKAKLAEGEDPQAVALALDYNDVDAMMAEVKSADMEAAVKSQVDAILSGEARPSLDDQYAALKLTSDYKAKLATVERKALIKAVVMVSKAEKATKQKTTEAEQAKSDARMAEAKAKWRQAAKDKAEQIRLKGRIDDVEFNRFMDDFKAERKAMIEEGAMFRDLTPSEAQELVTSAEAKIVKAIKNKDYEAAINAHLDLAIGTEALRQLATEPKAKAMAAVKREGEADYDYLAAVAKARVAAMPARLLDPKRPLQLAEAARDRAEAALARQDIAAYQQAKLDEAAAEAMASAVLDAKQAWDREAAIIQTILKSEDKTLRIQIGGRYYVRNPTTGYYKEYTNYVDANRDFQLRQAANGFEFGKTTELAEIRNAISDLTSKREDVRYAARVRLMAMEKDPEYNSVMPSEFRWFARIGFGDPDNWTVGQASIVRYQLETLLNYADTRINLAMESDKTIGELIAAVPAVVKPIAQDQDRAAVLKGARSLILSHQDLRSFLVSYNLGDAWTRFIVDPLNAGEAAARDAVEPWLQAVNGAIKKVRGAIDKTETIQGLAAKREENLMRVAHWGNTTGRQRVAADLQARGVTRPNEYMQEVLASLNEQEVGLLNAIWTEFDAMWVKQQNAARVAGVAVPPGVVPAEIVLPSGKKLKGGYVRVAYDNEAQFIPDFVTDKGEVAMGSIDSTMMKERVDVVEGKMLDLRIEAQEHSAYAHAKYIGYRPVVGRLNFIKNNETLAGATNKLGGDFNRDLWDKVRWAIDGSAKNRGPLDNAAGFFLRNVQSAVYLGNMLTSVKQAAGWVTAVGHPDVGSRGVVTSLQKAITNYEEWVKGPSKLSVMMRQRAHYQDLDFRAPSRVKGESDFKYNMRRWAGMPMRFFQYFSDLVVWNGAYMKALGKGANAADAVQVADTAVIETQGSGLKAEQTALTRTELGMLYTFGAKWSIKNANMLYRLWATNPGWDKRQFCYAIIWSLGISTGLMTFAGAVLQPQDEKDRQKTTSDYASAMFIDAVSSPHIALRYMIPFLMAQSGAEATATLGGPLKTPAMDFWNVWRSDSWQEAVTRSTGVAGALTGLPSTQLKRFEKVAFEGADNGFEAMFKAIFGEEYVKP